MSKHREALGSLQEMLAKQITGYRDGAQCAACGVSWEHEERHLEDCPVNRGLAIIEAALKTDVPDSGNGFAAGWRAAIAAAATWIDRKGMEGTANALADDLCEPPNPPPERYTPPVTAYLLCAKHQGMSYTMTATCVTVGRTLCPICEPPNPPPTRGHSIPCVHRDGCRKANECQSEQRCCGSDVPSGVHSEGPEA